MVNSRRKGHSFEREIANVFKEFYPDAMRELEYQADAVRGVDVKGCDPYLIQCKRGKKYAPLTKLEEVQTRDPEDIPLLVTKADRKKAIVAMYLPDFLQLLRMVEGKVKGVGGSDDE